MHVSCGTCQDDATETVPSTTPDGTKGPGTVPCTTPDDTERPETVPCTTPDGTKGSGTVPFTTPDGTEGLETVPLTTPDGTEGLEALPCTTLRRYRGPGGRTLHDSYMVQRAWRPYPPRLSVPDDGDQHKTYQFHEV